MPYIEPNRRVLFDNHINNIVAALGAATYGPAPTIDENKAKGDLNYVIYSIVKKYIETQGLKYHRINDFICGTLTHAQHELLRRISDTYENEAIKRNGDIE